MKQTPGIDSVQAKHYLDEARSICESDAGKLWGVSLCGPIMFVDPQSRSIAASQADGESRLTEQSGIFVGTLPAEINTANTAMAWAGVRWTMVQWPLPLSPTARTRLMMHELFHWIQNDLDLPLWAATALVVDVVGRAGRIVAGVNGQHGIGLVAESIIRLLYDFFISFYNYFIISSLEWWRRRESNLSSPFRFCNLLIPRRDESAKRPT